MITVDCVSKCCAIVQHDTVAWHIRMQINTVHGKINIFPGSNFR